jgi:hypothetical protein
LAHRLKAETPFVEYHALVALDAAINNDLNDEGTVVHAREINRAIEILRKKGDLVDDPGRDRQRLLNRILNGPTAFSRSGSENQTDQLQFNFGHETKVANGLYKTDHTFSVGVKNASQSQFLSNCKVYIDIPDEGGVTPKSYLIVDTFTLNATEERLVPIVRFDEPSTVSGHRGSTIQLMIPVAGGYYDVGWGWPWRLPIGAYTFTIRATAKEVGARQVVCKVSVDDAGRLHFGAA